MRGSYDSSWYPSYAWRRDRAVPASQVRVSDAERHEIAEALSRHFADGRLDQAEFDERLTKAMTAKTRGDLDAVVFDLPSLQRQTDVVPRPARGGRLWLGLTLGFFLLTSMTSLALNALSGHWWFVEPRLSMMFFLVLAFAMLRRRRARWDWRARTTRQF